MAPIYGIITALITPFDDKGIVDAAALRDLVELQVKGGVHGFFPLGTTGLGLSRLKNGSRWRRSSWTRCAGACRS